MLRTHEYLGIWDEPGAGKTKQTIDAACHLFEDNLIDNCVVVAPASVRGVWAHPDLGELRKHLWDTTPASIHELHAKSRYWSWGPVEPQRRLTWTITNYEFIRSGDRLRSLLNAVTRRTLLILDESSAVKSPKSQQTKSCMTLRARAGRVVLLNGTPISHSPLDMYSQGRLMHDDILGMRTFTAFRAKYAVIHHNGRFPKLVGWQNLDDLQKRFAPHVLRRLKEDCLDLPAKLPAVTIPVTLTPETWRVYRDMRDEMIAWLDEQTVAIAPQAVTKVMRLAQITSGFLGGIENRAANKDDDSDQFDFEPIPDYLPLKQARPEAAVALDEPQKPSRTLLSTSKGVIPLQEIGSEKLAMTLEWIGRMLEEKPDLKAILWGRFVAENHRLAAAIREQYPQVAVGMIVGGQKRTEREDAIKLLDMRTAPKGPVIVVANPASGSMGLTLVAADTNLYISHGTSLKDRKQSEDRTHRPGQIRPVWYGDMVAQGPNGQKTIDHHILRAIRERNDIATWTTDYWRKVLTEE